MIGPEMPSHSHSIFGHIKVRKNSYSNRLMPKSSQSTTMIEDGQKFGEKGSCCGPKCCGIAGAIGAIVFAVLAIILPFIVSDIIDKVIITNKFIFQHFFLQHFFKATETSSWNSYE